MEAFPIVVRPSLRSRRPLLSSLSKLAESKPADSAELTLGSPADRPTGGGLWAGVTHVLRSPYLAMICLFLFFVQLCGTQLYFEQAEIVRTSVTAEEDRTMLFAYLDLGTQLLTLVAQL